MYKLNKDNVKLVTKPSDINNNLSLLGVEEYSNAEILGVINGGYVNIIPLRENYTRARYVPLHNGKHRGKGVIKQVKWINIRAETFMIILSDIGLQIYSSETYELKYANSCQEEGDGQGYTQGVCCVNLHCLCVGSSMGTIWIFRASETMDIELINRHFAHNGPIMYLEGSENYLISSGVDKQTIIWTVQQGEISKFRNIAIEGMNSCCTSIIFSNYTIICGYQSGEITVSDILDDSINVRDVAHKLGISALDFTPLKYYILTGSRDGYVKIWEFINDYFLQLRFSVSTEHGPIVGAQFFNMNGTEFGTVSPYSNEVLCFIANDSRNQPSETKKNDISGIMPIDNSDEDNTEVDNTKNLLTFD